MPVLLRLLAWLWLKAAVNRLGFSGAIFYANASKSGNSSSRSFSAHFFGLVKILAQGGFVSHLSQIDLKALLLLM